MGMGMGRNGRSPILRNFGEVWDDDSIRRSRATRIHQRLSSDLVVPTINQIRMLNSFFNRYRQPVEGSTDGEAVRRASNRRRASTAGRSGESRTGSGVSAKGLQAALEQTLRPCTGPPGYGTHHEICASAA